MTIYKWNLERLPGWFIAALERIGAELTFNVEEIPEEKRNQLTTLAIILKLWEIGFIDARVEDGKVIITGNEQTFSLLTLLLITSIWGIEV